MNSREITEQIAKVDSAKYSHLPYYNSQKPAAALTALVNLEDDTLRPIVEDAVLSAIGNNHAGEYYSVTLSAIDFIIALALNGSSEVTRFCSFEILITLYATFTAVALPNDLMSTGKLEATINATIESYTERFKLQITNTQESERVKEDITELLGHITDRVA